MLRLLRGAGGASPRTSRNILEWLDAVKAKHGWGSDYRLAKELGIRTQNITNYRAGRSAMDVYLAVQIAELLDVDPLKVIASCEAERAKNDKRRGFWTKLAACVVLGSGLNAALPSPAEAAPVPGVYYVKSRKSKKQRLADDSASARDYVKKAGSAVLQMVAVLSGSTPRRFA